MQIAGELAPLADRGVEGALQQLLAVAVRPLDAARKHVREREQQQREGREGNEQDRRERAEELALAGRDRTEPLVGLQQQRRATVGRTDPR